MVVKVEYFLILADSTEFASQLAPLEDVDTIDVVLEQVKSQSSGKPFLQGIKDMPSGHHHDIHLQAPKQQVCPQTPEHDEQFH